MSADDLYYEQNNAPTATAQRSSDGLRDGDEDAQMRALGRDFVLQLFATSKAVQLYNIDNRVVQRSLNDLFDAMGELFNIDGRAVIRATNQFLYVNEMRLQPDSQQYGPFEYVREEIQKRWIGQIEFSSATIMSDVARFLKTMFEVEPGEHGCDQLQDLLVDRSLTCVTVTPWTEEETKLKELDEETQDLREESNRAYFRTAALMGDIMRAVEEKHVLQVRKAKHLTRQMVDIIKTDESWLLGLASIKNFDAYTFMHSVNVCILSMLTADRLMFDKADIARLGVAALFHDIGKTYIPSSIINSTGELNDREWELMKYHTIFGVKELLRTNSVREAVDPMFVALQHHVHYNMNGYPQRPGGWKLRLFSRIVTVADYYDAMTASRTYQREPVQPDKALRFILEKSGEIFDPLIAKAFVAAMGVYPVGSIVLLDTGERAIVVKQHPEPTYIHRPVVDLLDTSGDVTERVDLTGRAAGEFEFKRSVVRTLYDKEADAARRAQFVLDPSTGEE